MDRLNVVLLLSTVLPLFACGSEEESTSDSLVEIVDSIDIVEVDTLEEVEEEYVWMGYNCEVPPPTENDPCFPYPDEEYIKAMEDPNIPDYGSGNSLYNYVAYHFDSIEAKQYKEVEDEWDLGVYDWTQHFENGISYSELFYGEGGASATLYTGCSNFEAVYSTINALVNFKIINTDVEPEYEGFWNDNRTSYEPEEGVGCFYEIILDDSTGTYKVENYCGC